jgi:ribosomal protein S18 acetylase RimI-like enzyme
MRVRGMGGVKAMSNDPDDLIITAIDPREAAAAVLIAGLTEELARRYDEEDGSGNFQPADALGPRSGFVVGTIDGRPVACGAYRSMGPDVAEIKRMYVEPQYRGRGLGRRILDDLEARARRDGYVTVRLETGILQPEAIRLYESAGYRRIESYGIYPGNPRSVCFEKALRQSRDGEAPPEPREIGSTGGSRESWQMASERVS